MGTPPLPAGYTLQDDTPPLPKGYSLQSSASAAPPAPLSGPVGAGNGVPVPAGMSGPTAPTLGSSPGDVASTVGSHALNLVKGPLSAVVTPPQNTGEKVANVAMPGGLALYRTAVEPSIAPAKQALKQALAGKYGDAARSAESAVPVVGPWADQVEKDVQDKGAVAGLAGLATDVAVPQAIGAGAKAAGPALDESAAGVINKGVIGARDADRARGANPGRGYLDNGLGISATMQSIADKAGEARAEVGKALGDAYSAADAKGTLIPAETVRKAVGDILTQAKQKASAPGVVADPAVYDQLAEGFKPALTNAWNKGGFTPSELWQMRKDMNESLNWGDQSKLNVTKTQQRISGALGGLLKDAVPETEELNQNYQDLAKLHGRASKRAATGQGTLTGLASKATSIAGGAIAGAATHNPLMSAGGAALGAAVDSIPAKTALASGLHAAASAAPAAPAASLPTTLAAVSGNGQPSQVGDTPEGSSQQEPEKNVSQPAPPEQQYTPVTTPEQLMEHNVQPETHDFSVSEWVKSNPGGDVEEAMRMAEEMGYEVVK